MGNVTTGVVKKSHIETIVFKRDNVNKDNKLPCPEYKVRKR